MLESSILVLHPWQALPGGRAWCCAVVDGVSGEQVGFARRVRPAGLARLRRPRISVHESGDEPLLLTLSRGFLPWSPWLVHDAEGRFIGRVSRAGQVLDRTAVDLGAVETNASETRLTFRSGERDNPFVRMLLLAGAVVNTLAGRASAGRALAPWS